MFLFICVILVLFVSVTITIVTTLMSSENALFDTMETRNSLVDKQHAMARNHVQCEDERMLTLVINLSRRTENITNVETLDMYTEFLDSRIVPATDLRMLRDNFTQNVQKLIDDMFIAPAFARAAFMGMQGHLACAMSHVRAWRFAQHVSPTRPTLILEDDVDLSDFSPEILADVVTQVGEIDNEWEILLLGWSCDVNHWDLCALNPLEMCHDGDNNTPRVIKPKLAIGFYAYVINTKHINNILTNILPLQWTLDIEVWKNKCKCYAVLPHVVKHPGKMIVSKCDYYSTGYIPEYYHSDTNRPT